MKIVIIAMAALSLSAGASAQGSIAIGTPVTFTPPPSISSYIPKMLSIEPGAAARIVVVVVSNDSNARELTFEYPRDCVAPGASSANPNPAPVCANLDTSAEVDALITQLNTVNLTTRSLWRRVFDRLVADFPSRFPGGGTVQ